MSRARFLPVVMVVVGGALALRAIGGVADLPQMFEGAKAFAEEMAPKQTPTQKGVAKDKAAVNALLARPPAPPVSPAALESPRPASRAGRRKSSTGSSRTN